MKTIYEAMMTATQEKQKAYVENHTRFQALICIGYHCEASRDVIEQDLVRFLADAPEEEKQWINIPAAIDWVIAHGFMKADGNGNLVELHRTACVLSPDSKQFEEYASIEWSWDKQEDASDLGFCHYHQEILRNGEPCFTCEDAAARVAVRYPQLGPLDLAMVGQDLDE